MKLILFLSLILVSPWSFGAEEYVTGVSPEAISLPSLPGSVEGLPGSSSVLENKGQFNFKIDIKVPKGVNNLTPSLAIQYASSAGQSEFGLGWTLNLQTIELDSKRGVPKYDGTDRYVGPDGDLVKINRPGSNQFFAAYINKNQNIYEFDENEKTWILHQGDGRKIYFGSENSTITNDGQVYKWFLDKIVDPSGNEIRYEYSKIDGYPFLVKVKYAFKDNSPHYRISFSYEDREDVLNSYKSTFQVSRIKRCSSIKVESGEDFVIRSYVFSYNDLDYTKGTLLTSIKQKGEGEQDLNPSMPPVKFEYSQINLEQSYKTTKLNFADSEVFPPSLNKSRATFVDINRDSFPDILETSRMGAKVWLNDKNGGFETHYSIPQFISLLGTNQTKLLDVDGDRIVDFVATGLYPQFYKGGVQTSPGQLGFSSSPVEVKSIPKYSISASNVKTIDINADGRMDIIAREVGGFKTFLSSESGTWDRVQDYVVNTGAFDLSSRYTFFADMNGDGLTDLVFVRPESVTYLPNRGNGLFADPIVMEFGESNPLILKLFKIGKYNFVSDINGDGYNDLINVTESTVAISLNNGNNSFCETYHLTDIHEDDFNLKGLHITVGDMNGNNTTDIVWTNDFHDWRYLDFSSGLQNLITKVDNGLGLKTHVEYAFATSMGDSFDSLETVVPHPMVVVSRITETLGNETAAIREDLYKYFGGFYHALENEFRGFNLVEKVEVGDSSIDSLLTKTTYEQGRIGSKDHQQSMPLKKSDYEYNVSQKAVGNLLKSEDYSLSTLETFASTDFKTSGMPFNSQIIFTEGDFDPQTPDRKHKIERQITLSSDGFISRDRILTYIDLSQIVRQEEKVLAISNISNAHITNRVCENNTYNASNSLLTSERYLYDNQEDLCSLTTGLTTKKLAWTGSSYETKNTYTYSSFGSLNGHTDSFGRLTTISYDSLDINPTTIINPAAHTRTAVFNPQTGLMDSVTDENNLTTQIKYDLYQRLNKIIGPADTLSLPTTETIYSFGSSNGELSSIITKKREKSGVAGTLDSKEYFDGKGRSRYKITEGPTDKNVLEATTYNSRNEKHHVFQKSFVSSFNVPSSVSGIRTFETKYDSLKRPTLLFNPEHSTSEPSYKENFYLVGEGISYDEERKVSYEYRDSLGRRIGHQDALQNTVSYEFDPLDQMVKITDPQGSITLFGYDSQKRRTCKLDPTVGLTRYAYNSENLIVQTDSYGFVLGHDSCVIPSGVTPRTVKQEYNDSLNRITKKDFPDISNTEDILYHYDEASSTYSKGKLSSVYFGVGSKKFDFDVYGNTSRTTLSIGPSSYITEKVYNVLGKEEKVIYPVLGSNALTIKYDFDNGGNLKSVKDDSNSYFYAVDFTYSPLNQLESGVFGNNTKFSMNYDEINQSYRLTDIMVEKVGTPNIVLQNIHYEYDKVSNISQRDDQANSFVEKYYYDDLHRLTGAALGGGTKVWSIDSIGNITNNGGVIYNYDLNRKQIVSNVGPSSYSFDSFGNISEDANREYHFDWNNRLRSITKLGLITTYDYSEEGIRISKTTPSLTTVFVDKFTELRGSEVVRHIYGDGKLIASIDELNNVTFNHPDHLNTSNVRTDATGSLVKRIEYQPFGETRLEVGSYNSIKQRFTGQYNDEESGLYYYQQRYYDPILSRFISADPLYLYEMSERGKDSQELNVFAYVRNNPLKYKDPTGLSFEGNPIAAMFDPANEKAAADMQKGLETAIAGILGSRVATALGIIGGAAVVAGAKAVAASAPMILVEAGARPDLTQKVIDNGISAISEIFFEGKGTSPGAPENAVDMFYFLKENVMPMLDNNRSSPTENKSNDESSQKYAPEVQLGPTTSEYVPKAD